MKQFFKIGLSLLILGIVMTAMPGCESDDDPDPVAGTDASLADLTVTDTADHPGALSPAFTPGVHDYTYEMGSAVADGDVALTITPTQIVPGGTLTVNGTPVVSGDQIVYLLSPASGETYTIVSGAQDGLSEETYTITVSLLGII